MSELHKQTKHLRENLFSKKFIKVHRFFKCLGQSTFTIDSQTGDIRKSKILYFTSVIGPLVFLCGSINYGINLIDEYRILDHLFAGLSLLIYYVIIVNSILKTDRQISIINQLNQIDLIFYRKFYFLINRGHYKKIVTDCFGLLLFTIACWVTIMTKSIYTRSYEIYYLTTILPLICVGVHLTLCKIYVDHLKVRLSCLYEVMENAFVKYREVNLGESSKSFFSVTIEQQITHQDHYTMMKNCKKLYTKLVRLCGAINDCMGITFLFFITFAFIIIPSCLFWFYEELYKDSGTFSIICRINITYNI